MLREKCLPLGASWKCSERSPPSLFTIRALLSHYRKCSPPFPPLRPKAATALIRSPPFTHVLLLKGNKFFLCRVGSITEWPPSVCSMWGQSGLSSEGHTKSATRNTDSCSFDNWDTFGVLLGVILEPSVLSTPLSHHAHVVHLPWNIQDSIFGG